MKKDRVSWSGWIVAALLGGVMIGSGFQAPSTKLGVVDLNLVIDKSDAGAKSQTMFAEMKASREKVLEFLDQYRIMTIEQAQRFRELSLKIGKTKTEEAELDRIRADVIATSKRSQELATKMNLSPEERTMIEEYSRRSQTIGELSARWLREFADEVQQWISDEREKNYRSARAAVTEVASKEGYTMIFEGTVALYGANDITEPTLAAMNAKKN